jgi:hypothetical protein
LLGLLLTAFGVGVFYVARNGWRRPEESLTIQNEVAR